RAARVLALPSGVRGRSKGRHSWGIEPCQGRSAGSCFGAAPRLPRSACYANGLRLCTAKRPEPHARSPRYWSLGFLCFEGLSFLLLCGTGLDHNSLCGEVLLQVRRDLDPMRDRDVLFLLLDQVEEVAELVW